MKKLSEQFIPARRLIVYIVIGAFLPIVVALWWTLGAISEAEMAYETMVSLGERIQTKVSLQEHNRYFFQKFCDRDPLFLHRKLEPLPLLTGEVACLQKRVQRGMGPEDVLLEKRLQFLTSPENRFSFVEGSTEVFAHHKETVENQSKPVEIDSRDLETVLNLLENDDDDASKPHCIVSELRLDRKKDVFQETWGILIKVLRREYFA